MSAAIKNMATKPIQSSRSKLPVLRQLHNKSAPSSTLNLTHTEFTACNPSFQRRFYRHNFLIQYSISVGASAENSTLRRCSFLQNMEYTAQNRVLKPEMLLFYIGYFINVIFFPNNIIIFYQYLTNVWNFTHFIYNGIIRIP